MPSEVSLYTVCDLWKDIHKLNCQKKAIHWYMRTLLLLRSQARQEFLLGIWKDVVVPRNFNHLLLTFYSQLFTSSGTKWTAINDKNLLPWSPRNHPKITTTLKQWNKASCRHNNRIQGAHELPAIEYFPHSYTDWRGNNFSTTPFL